MSIEALPLHNFIGLAMANLFKETSSLVHALAKQALAKQAHALEGLNIEDKFFTPYDFISLTTRTTLTLSWILGKPLLKPKRAHIYTKMQKAHGSIS